MVSVLWEQRRETVPFIFVQEARVEDTQKWGHLNWIIKDVYIWIGTQVRSLGQENALEDGMATHASILAWRIPWTEDPGGLQSKGLQRVGHDWATNIFTSHIWIGREGREGHCRQRKQHMQMQRECLKNLSYILYTHIFNLEIDVVL